MRARHARSPASSTLTVASRVEVRLTPEQLAAAAGITPQRLGRLVRVGLVEPLAQDAPLFSADTAARLRRMLRLHADLGVNLVGAAIIVDLVERLDAAMQEARRRS